MIDAYIRALRREDRRDQQLERIAVGRAQVQRVEVLDDERMLNVDLEAMPDGGVITIPAGFDARINPDGSIFARAPGQPSNAPGVEIGRLMLRDAEKTPLSRRADGLFEVAGKPPGQDIPVAPNSMTSVTPQALEGSNVNAMAVMLQLMDQSRTFETQVKMIKENKTGDEAGSSMLKLS